MSRKKQQLKPDIGVLLSTHDRIEDAYVNQEIIRNVWERSGLFGSIRIVHAYNGKKSWYPKKYLEDLLIRKKNPGHFRGGCELLDAGMAVFHRRHPGIRYVVVLAADTWLLEPAYVHAIVQTLHRKEQYWATCAWDVPVRNEFFDVGAAMDFFVLDQQWAKRYRMFPIRYKEFFNKYSELFLYRKGSNVSPDKLILARFLQACYRDFGRQLGLRQYATRKIHFLKERNPIHSHIDERGFWIRNHFWPKLGLLTHHDAEAKQKAFLKFPKVHGKHAEKFRAAKNLAYFNRYVQIRGENPA